MAYNLLIVGLILVFVKEALSAREGYLVNVLLYFVGGHADTVIDNGEGLSVSVGYDINPVLVALRSRPLAYALELLKLSDSVAAV